jgi:hypothetical protein
MRETWKIMAELMENIIAAPAAWIILQSTSRFKLVDSHRLRN